MRGCGLSSVTLLQWWYTFTQNGCIPIVMAGIQIWLSLFIVKVASDPINQHVEWGCSREEWYLMVLILMLFFFFNFFTRLPSFKYLFSSLFELGSARGNEFLYEVKYEICGAELLMHLYVASTMASPKRRICKFLSYVQCHDNAFLFWINAALMLWCRNSVRSLKSIHI